MVKKDWSEGLRRRGGDLLYSRGEEEVFTTHEQDIQVTLWKYNYTEPLEPTAQLPRARFAIQQTSLAHQNAPRGTYCASTAQQLRTNYFQQLKLRIDCGNLLITGSTTNGLRIAIYGRRCTEELRGGSTSQSNDSERFNRGGGSAMTRGGLWGIKASKDKALDLRFDLL